MRLPASSTWIEAKLVLPVAAMTSIIEPLLIIFLAVIVGTIVIALFMPLVSIIGGLSG